MKILECSSKGDSRFSALFAKVKVYGVEASIESHYQRAKRFERRHGIRKRAKNWKQAKEWQRQGWRTVDIEINGIVLPVDYLGAYYKVLWVKYLDQHPELVEYAKEFDDYNDIFKGNSINCQADVIRQYMKDGRSSIMTEVRDFTRLLSGKTFVRETVGDLLRSHENVIGHQTNCLGVMGARLAKEIKGKYPQVYEEYVKYCLVQKRSFSLMGTCQIVEAEPGVKWVANLFGQFEVGTHKKQTEDAYLKKALETLKNEAQKNEWSVALPYQLGSGLGGGDWNEIRKIIDDVFHDYPVTIYRLPGV